MLDQAHSEARIPPIAFRSLVADFRAAIWCEGRPLDIDDATLLKGFHRVHESFLRAIDRSRPGLFAGVERSFFVDVIRRWIAMYVKGVQEVRGRFPRTDDSADLVALDQNWSERLGIAYEGLDRLDIVSRYAEYWAERAITWETTHERGRGVLETYDARMAFIGSRFYVLAEAMMHGRRIMLVDGARNGMTAFDLHALFRAAEAPSQLEERCEALEWRVSILEPDARQLLWEAAH